MSKTKPETYFYFSNTDKKLRHGDNRTIRTGITHTVEGGLKLCHSELHASKNIMDALGYAPGPYLWVVTLSGDTLKGNDKVCASERTYLAEADLEKVLRKFARKQALINIEKIKPYCTVKEYELILRWLETGDETLREKARSAARSAADSAAYSAARSTYSAADSAACSAAYSAARSAARSAAYSAADSATYSAAYSAADSAAYSATYSAADSATYSAAYSAAEEMLLKMLPSNLRKCIN